MTGKPTNSPAPRAVAFIVAALLILFANCKPCFAGGPENVLVVVNSESEASKAVANLYVELRKIPPANVVYLDNVPKGEQTNVGIFRWRILKPILDAIQERNLGQQIDYIVYSADFPTVIEIKEDVANTEDLPRQYKNKTYKPYASINALTYFSPIVMAKKVHYMPLNSNWYMRTNPRSGLLSRPFVGEDLETFQSALRKMSDESYDEAIEEFNELLRKHRTQIGLIYQLARCYAKKGEANKCARALNLATQFGWCYRQYTLDDKAFESVNDSDDFKTVIQRIPDQPFEFLPTQSFRSGYVWGPNGIRNGTVDQGQRYVISTVLAVTRGRGTSLDEALAQIRRSVEADESMPTGKFYFTFTGDVRSKTRRNTFKTTIRDLKAIGYDGEIINGYAPLRKKDILGATLGTAKVDWGRTNTRLMPGAIVDNLTSYGGIMRKNSSQTPCTDFIKSGAAGASGTVIEPYALAAKFPHSRIHYHYAKGCTLGEAFYQSVHGPFQLLIVGDALCQPFNKKPRFSVEGLKPGEQVKGRIKLDLKIDPESPSLSLMEVYFDGVLKGPAPLNQSIGFDTTQLSDGHHEIRLVGVSGTLIQSKQSVVIPFEINNKGQTIDLSCEKTSAGSTEQISLTYKSDFAEKVELVHNERVLATSSGAAGSFSILANKLGEGTVKVFARTRVDDQVYLSTPIQLDISR